MLKLFRDDNNILRIQYKDMLYSFLRPVAWLASYRLRVTNGWKSAFPELRLNLGCGTRYLTGWVNLDIVPYRHKDVWLDIRDTWPFGDNEVQIVYSNHVFEHFDLQDFTDILKQSLRVLKPGGLLRFGVPSLEKAISAYNTDDFEGLPATDQASKSRGRKFNEAILYHSQHKLMFDFSFAKEMLEQMGFVNVTQCRARESQRLSPEELAPSEDEYYEKFTLYVEAFHQ